MSGESIYGLYAKSAAVEKQSEKTASPYTGKYEKHMGEPTKPVYSTFFEKGKEYDGSNVRFFKQREAVIGKNVGDSVDPQNFLKKGGGIHHVVPPVHEEKLYLKPPLVENFRENRNGNDGDANQKGRGLDGLDDDSMPCSGSNGYRSAGADDGGMEHGEGLMNAESMQPYEGVEYDENGNPLYGQQGIGNTSAGGGYGASCDATKNFVASNIVEVSNMVPKRRKEQVPLATERKSFGKTPAYLSRVKGEVAQEKAFVQSLEDAKLDRQQQAFSKFVYLLPREEHEKLVSALKARLNECVSQLQKMPFSKDIPSMRKKKAELERTIADIEAALKKLDKDALFVYKDDPVNGQWAKEAALKEAQKYAAQLL